MLFLLLVLGGLLLRMPPVQTHLMGYATDWLGENTGFPTTVERVEWSGLDEVVLQNVRVRDSTGAEMIHIRRAWLDLNFWKLLQDQRNITLDRVQLDRPVVHATLYRGKRSMALSNFINNIAGLTPPADTSQPGFQYALFKIEEAHIKQGKFVYHDQEEAPLPENQFDYYHFTVGDIDASLRDFFIRRDTIGFRAKSLSGITPQTGLRIRQLATGFEYTADHLNLHGLDAYIGQSHINDTLEFHFQDNSDWSDFNDKIRMEANLHHASVAYQDLKYFAPELKNFDDDLYLHGRFSGTVEDFRFSSAAIAFGDMSRLYGNISMSGLPNFQETFIDARLNRSFVAAEDLMPYASAPKAREIFRKMGNTEINGSFTGFPTDFVAQGEFYTALGRFHSDLRLNFNREIPHYSGKFRSKSFDAGTLLEKPELGQVAFNGSIEGQGLSLEQANLDVRARINKMQLGGYTYRNLLADAHLQDRRFQGLLNVNDPNLKMQMNGNIDLRQLQETVRVSAAVDTIDFARLHWIDDSLAISGRLNMDFKGLSLDEVAGEGNFANLKIDYYGRQTRLDTLWFYSALDSSRRTFRVGSEDFELSMTGDYRFNQVMSDLNYLGQDFRAMLTGAEPDTLQRPNPEEYHLNFDLWVDSINPLLHLKWPQLSISPTTRLSGEFMGGKILRFQFDTYLDSLRYAGNTLKQTQLDFILSKVNGEKDVLASLFLNSQAQSWEGVPPTENFFLRAGWRGDRIRFNTELEQQSNNNSLRGGGQVAIGGQNAMLLMDSAHIRLLDADWHLTEKHPVFFASQSIKIPRLTLTGGNRQVNLLGKLSPHPQDTFSVMVKNFELGSLPLDWEAPVGGRLTGQLRIAQALAQPHFSGSMDLRHLSLGGLEMGRARGQWDWERNGHFLKSRFHLTRAGDTAFLAQGNYYPYSDSSETLDFDLSFNRSRLALLETFFGDYISDVEGYASGHIHAGGTPEQPLLSGAGKINDGAFRFDYTQTRYLIEDSLYIGPGSIEARNAHLFDAFGHYAALEKAGIYHDNFQDWRTEIRAKLNNFQVLNTEAEDNSLYYGDARVSGTMGIEGPLEDVLMTANLKSEANTKLYIPLEEDNKVGESTNRYITFVDQDSLHQDSSHAPQKLDLSGLRLDYNLEFTPEAYMEIIFDQANGDKIKGYGQGKLNLSIDTRGEFTMLGTYEILKGSYNFTLPQVNFVNKKFDIREGSTISWNGDPYGGKMDVTAEYQKRVSLAPIAVNRDSSFLNRPAVQHPYPTAVLMNLQGELLQPEITFDIDIKDYPNILGPDVQSFEARIQNNEQELNRQVFTLIILNRLTLPQAQNLQGGVAAGGSFGTVSEFASNEISRWVSEVDENLEIDIDLGNLSQNAMEAFQVRVSYRLLNDRLRITREGTFTNTRNQTTATSVAGDWTVEYLLTREGKLRVKMFHQNNQNLISNALNANNTTQGLSLIHTKSFNTFGEFIDFLRQKKKDRAEGAPDNKKATPKPPPPPRTESRRTP